MGCRGLVYVVVMKTVGVGEMVSGFGENYGLVVSGLLCWRREGDDKVEREAGRRWAWRFEGSGKGIEGKFGFQGLGREKEGEEEEDRRVKKKKENN